MRTFPADHPLGKKARKLIRELFPEGAEGITQQAFEDQLSAMDEMNEQLASYRVTHVDPLDHGPVVDRLAELTEDYREELEKPATREITFKKVKAARKQGQERMLQVVAKILGEFNGEEDGDAETRQKLMTPILEQNERIAYYYQNHEPVVDVDPETGEDLVEDDEEGGDPADGEG